jgi:hypothetical protein
VLKAGPPKVPKSTALVPMAVLMAVRRALMAVRSAAAGVKPGTLAADSRVNFS